MINPGKEWSIDLEMSRRNHGKSPKMDLMLTRARGGPSREAEMEIEEEEEEEGSKTSLSSSASPASSCVSEEEEQQQKKYGSPEAATSMVLAGCPHCLMYVMLAEKEAKCPKCKSAVLVDFHGGAGKSAKSRRS